jgi:superfamily II DNA/RNA helicase
LKDIMETTSAASAAMLDTSADHLGLERTEPEAANAAQAAAPAPAVEGGFDALGLHPAILKAVRAAGYTAPTAVQERAIPAALAGQDLLVSSSTGSGKTAAFVLPALQRILAARGDNTKRREKGVVYGPRVLVLAPTRELALQVAKACDTYGRQIPGLRVATVLGGVPYGAQLKALRGPLDVLIATPGRLIDHLNSGAAVLSSLETLVLDEADRMLDMGFIEDIETIAAATPAERQTLMFSATFAGHVGRLAQRLTRDPQRIEVASHTDSHENIEQRLYWVDHTGHRNDLLDHFLTERELDQAVVFTSTQIDADRLADRLADMGHAVAALHGGMPQGKRNRVLLALRQKRLRILIATDVAARGIDVPTITHVINYGLPMKPEDYVHRIGRTGRAGRSGLAVTLAGRDDQFMVRRIERFTTQRIPVQTVEGLEPTKPAPQDRPAGGFGGKGGNKFGKPMPGQRRREEGGARFGGPRHDDRGPREGGWAPRPQREGFEPRGEGSFDRAPRAFEPRGDRPHAGDGGFRGQGEGNRPFGDRGQPYGDRGGFRGDRTERRFDGPSAGPRADREGQPAGFRPAHRGPKPGGFGGDRAGRGPGAPGGFKPRKPGFRHGD